MHQHVLVDLQREEGQKQHRHDDDAAANAQKTGDDALNRAGRKQYRDQTDRLGQGQVNHGATSSECTTAGSPYRPTA